MESKNADRLSLLIDFLRFDAKGEGAKAGLGNVELAAADYLANHFNVVVSGAEIYDEVDAQTAYDAEKIIHNSTTQTISQATQIINSTTTEIASKVHCP